MMEIDEMEYDESGRVFVLRKGKPYYDTGYWYDSKSDRTLVNQKLEKEGLTTLWIDGSLLLDDPDPNYMIDDLLKKIDFAHSEGE